MRFIRTVQPVVMKRRQYWSRRLDPKSRKAHLITRTVVRGWQWLVSTETGTVTGGHVASKYEAKRAARRAWKAARRAHSRA